MMAAAVRRGGWVVAQEPITSAGRIAGSPLSMPDARHPDVGALLPALVRDAGLEVIDAWAEAPAGVGPGPVARYLESLTGVDPGRRPGGASPAGDGHRPPRLNRPLPEQGALCGAIRVAPRDDASPHRTSPRAADAVDLAQRLVDQACAVGA